MNSNVSSLSVEGNGIAKATLSDDEVAKISSLLNIVWPDSVFTIEYLNWLYRMNPLGQAESYNVWDNGLIVAHYAAIPIEANLSGSIEKGLLSLNTAVHPDFRGKGYFKELASQTFENARLNGFNFVVGVANASSTTLFRRQLKFQLVCPLTVKIGLGKVSRKSGAVSHLDYAQIWNKDTLNWRLSRPNSKYHITSNSDSVMITAATGKYGIWAKMYDYKSICISGQMLNHKPYFRWNPVSIWIGLDPACDWSNSSYVALPEKLKLSPLNLIFKDLTSMNRKLDPRKVLYSLIDFDAY